MASTIAPVLLGATIGALVSGNIGVHGGIVTSGFFTAVAAQTVLILFGWALAQYPYLSVPDVSLHAAAASLRMQRLLLVALAAGLAVLVPSLILLSRVFKRSTE